MNIRRIFCLLAALLLAFAFLPPEDTRAESDDQLTEEVLLEESESGFPALTAAGFLSEGEFVQEDTEAGIWRYASESLRVEIFRRTQDKPKQVWYEAEIWCAEGSQGPRMIANNPDNWVKGVEYPYKIARKTGTVIALSGDYAHTRAQQKSRVGIILRDGAIKSDRTYKRDAKHFPNLDCLAIWPDGDMQVFYSDEHTAQEYVDMGAVDVLSFGPWLIRDGQLNEAGLAKYGKSTAQRAAVGMVEKGHYFFMMLEGRITRSRGAGISFLAEKLLAQGCTVAFNLDGGQTASILFMGHQLCKMDNKRRNLSSRTTSDILGVGFSELLPAVGDPW